MLTGRGNKMELKKITENTRLRTLSRLPEFQGFGHLLAFPQNFGWAMNLYKIKNYKKFLPDFDSTTCAKSLDLLMNRKRNGQDIYYPISSSPKTALLAYVIGEQKPFVLICPGGGYGSVASIDEGCPIALRFNELGYNAFVLHYRYGREAHYPNPQDDVAAALKKIFEIAPERHIQIKDYAIAGFSAGGHLAASFGIKSIGYQKYGLPVPKAMILGYPVITMGDNTHMGSRLNLLGKENSENEKLIELYSIEKQAEHDYPQTFLWCCKDDSVVSATNSIKLSEVLQKSEVRVSLKLVEGDKHGWGIATGTKAEGWVEEAISFWQS